MAVPQDISAFVTLRDSGDILLAIYDNAEKKYRPIYPRYFNVQRGDRFTETILGLVGPTQLQQQAFGQATPFEDVLQGYKTTVDAQKWGRGVMFTEEAFKFDKSGRLRRMPELLARASNYAAEVEAARILNEASTTNHADTGKPLSDDAQLLKRGGTFDNEISGDLSVAVLDSALVQFAKFVDDNNELINIMPRYLIHTPDDGRVARQLLGSDKEPYTADNQINDFRGRVEAIQNPFLTDADNAFLVAAPEDNGLDYVDWMVTRRKAWVDDDADVLKFKVNRMMKATFHKWQGFIGIIGV